MKNNKWINTFVAIVLVFSALVGKSQYYVVNSIDTFSLTYYNWMNISPVDSIEVEYNLLSNKVSDEMVDGETIEVGKAYFFKLEPMYEIVKKKGELDSVYYSPTLMKSIVINGVLLFNENFSVHPFLTEMLVNQKYINLNDSVYEFQIEGMDSTEVDSISVYFLEWKKKRRFAIGFHQIVKYHEHYYKTSGLYFYMMFDDYYDCYKKLSSWQKLEDGEESFLNSLVEFRFDTKVIRVYFDIEGHYYFNGQWYRPNYTMYYLLFRYFSDEIIPQTVLQKAKENSNGRFWE